MRVGTKRSFSRESAEIWHEIVQRVDPSRSLSRGFAELALLYLVREGSLKTVFGEYSVHYWRISL